MAQKVLILNILSGKPDWFLLHGTGTVQQGQHHVVHNTISCGDPGYQGGIEKVKAWLNIDLISLLIYLLLWFCTINISYDIGGFKGFLTFILSTAFLFCIEPFILCLCEQKEKSEEASRK
ncbi:MAG: hypothetical protein HY225_01595 [Candidatus Vogelbacteria bacterium]|nr:hypothetical protein [Candidatus Vogelbacteria bacterium]